MLLMYFLNDFEMVPVAVIITGITFVCTFHIYYYYYYHHHHHHHYVFVVVVVVVVAVAFCHMPFLRGSSFWLLFMLGFCTWLLST